MTSLVITTPSPFWLLYSPLAAWCPRRASALPMMGKASSRFAERRLE